MTVVWEDRAILDLDRYVDSFQSQGTTGQTSAPAGLEEMAALVRWLKYALVPVAPAPLFREALHARLLAAAKVGLATPAPSWSSLHRRELLIGAAVGSVLSMAGLAAFVYRLRWVDRNAA